MIYSLGHITVQVEFRKTLLVVTNTEGTNEKVYLLENNFTEQQIIETAIQDYSLTFRDYFIKNDEQSSKFLS